MAITPSRIGFIATHFNGIDHVSFESYIWRDVLTQMGHECFYFAGESNQAEERTVIVPEASTQHDDIKLLHRELYENGKRSSKTSGTIQALRFHIKQHLHQFLQTFDINILIVENALALPANIPLGLALSEVIGETDITCLARHHNFAWEQLQYRHSPARDYLLSSFPPKLPSVEHIVATRAHADELAMRVGVHARIIPYVRDFHNPLELTTSPDELTDEMGLPAETRMVLSTSPLRPSSQIEGVLAYIARMEHKPELILTSLASEQDPSYLKFIMETADLLQIKVHLMGERLKALVPERERLIAQFGGLFKGSDFTLTMGQTQEAAAEAINAIYFGVPMLSFRHNAALRELKRMGFQFLEIENPPHLEAVRAVEVALEDTEQVHALVEHNFQLGVEHLSLDTLRGELAQSLQRSLTS
jgi:hypothetical protein